MKIKKIQMIEEPRMVLNPSEMDSLIGGTNCVSYRDGLITDTCLTYNGAPCTAGGDTPYCISYLDTWLP